jgi:hypothetical protein
VPRIGQIMEGRSTASWRRTPNPAIRMGSLSGGLVFKSTISCIAV